MANAYNVSNSFFEDDEANIIFFYSGKDSVLGLTHPDCIIKNADHMRYARIAFLTPSDLGDTDTPIYIEEKIHVDAFTPVENSMDNMKSFSIVVGALAQSKRIKRGTVYSTVTNQYAHDINAEIKVYITEDSYLNSDGEKRYGLGVWVDCGSNSYIATTIEKSYSANSCPIDNDHYDSGYEASYLTTDTIHTDVNMTNSEDTILANLIVQSTQYNDDNNKRLSALEEKTKYMPFGFVQNTIVYDNIYKPSAANTDEIITPTSVRGITMDRIVKLDPANKAFTVLKDGAYFIQLKNGLYLSAGESDVTLSMYKETEELKDARLDVHLYTKNNKPIKQGFSSNMVSCNLSAGDKIYIKANWDTTDNLVVNNETIVSITASMYY